MNTRNFRFGNRFEGGGDALFRYIPTDEKQQSFREIDFRRRLKCLHIGFPERSIEFVDRRDKWRRSTLSTRLNDD
ncbi:MAG: hypothetical protein LBC40_02035 [Dysgonamonadaceae bacterium]|nr:hypothetical protein [Dysgonamonadaceae bacterium]